MPATDLQRHLTQIHVPVHGHTPTRGPLLHCARTIHVFFVVVCVVLIQDTALLLGRKKLVGIKQARVVN